MSTAPIALQPASCADYILNGAHCAAAGAITAAIFGTFNPLIGAAFGATQAISCHLLYAIIGQGTDINPALSSCLKIALFIPIFIASTIAAMFITATFGFPITLLTGVAFSLAMIVGHLATIIIKGGLKCYSQCISGTTFV